MPPNHMFEVVEIPFRDIPSKWITKVMLEMFRCCDQPGWNPKLVHLEDNTYMVDLAVFGDAKIRRRRHHVSVTLPHSIQTIEYVDHPWLLTAPEHCPRVVKSLFRKEVRLKHLRATDYWVIHEDVTKAYEAWVSFKERVGHA